ncbi:DUF1499 domain-containing protein [Gayadomonas joobiniege]|uniref:DUF1499 domain-containing protein n=1 Tax=Gayadomonas joobiniege TaxID=1234606 RepID=UPI0003681D49|nr:DUF1499 domain-containing protein [Gayadomonas joobiniege]
MLKTLLWATSLIALAMVTLPGLLYQFELINLGTAFKTLKSSHFVVYASSFFIAIALFIAIGKKQKHLLVSALVCLCISLVAFAGPIVMFNNAKKVPAIHDITTDTVNPPEFVAIKPLRKNAPNPAEYTGAETAAKQLKAYPDLKPLYFKQDKKTVFNAAVAAINAQGIKLVDSDLASGRIEGADKTLWFGFKDDVVLRISEQSGQTKVDIRSKSRLGKSDLGKNAERIMQIGERIKKQLKE